MANLSSPPPSLAYRLQSDSNGVLRVAWEGPVDHTATSLLEADPDPDLVGPTALAEARQLLEQLLADGPQPAAQVLAAAHQAGLSLRTLRRASRSLEIRPRKAGPRGAWVWQLPAADPSPVPLAPTQPAEAAAPALV